MGEHELTYTGQSGYHGYMEPSAEPTPNGQRGSSPERSSEQPAQEGEENVEPKEADSDARLREQNKEQVNPRRTTKEHLGKLAEQLAHPQSPGQVVAAAEQVLYAAKMLERSAANLPPEAKERLASQDFVGTAQQLLDSFKSMKGRLIDGDHDAQVAGRNQQGDSVMRRAGEVAALANGLKDYFEREKIAPQERDPYKPIQSFEELMTKWVDVVEDKFRPGGEFALIDVEEYTDEFGRTILKETAHPENFMRWVREKIEFYHDFDPYKPINLFQNLYLTVGFRTVSVYEMLVDVPTYFYHREPALGELQVTLQELSTAKDDGNFSFTNEYLQKYSGSTDRIPPDQPVGYYNLKDPKTGKDIEYEVRFAGRDQSGMPHFDVFTKDKDGKFSLPVQAVTEDRDKWQGREDKRFGEIKEELLYEVWLLNEIHNYDVAYRMQGMPTQQELKKVMNEIYNFNMLTKNRDRIYKLFKMPTTTKRGGDSSEVGSFMGGEMKDKQGSVGKAMQRALAAYYHLAEANATANGYKIEGPNPFEEMLRKGNIDGSEIFYKSLIRQTLKEHFGFNDEHLVANELVAELNKGRKEYEKADLYDVLVLDRQSLMVELQKRGFTQEQLDTAVRNLQKLYQEGGKKKDKEIAPDLQKAAELQRLLTSSTLGKKHHLFNSLKGKYGITDEWLSGSTQSEGSAVQKAFKEFWTKDGLDGLDGFAVKFFGLTYDSWGTPDTNVYVNINYSLQARDMVKKAMRDVLQQTEKLDDFEAIYAEEYAFVMTYFTGISARNDMLGIGHDAWAKIINTEYYRLRQSGGGNYPGNLDNLYGIHRLGVDFWEGMIVQEEGRGKLDKTLYEVLVGLDKKDGDTYTFNINRNIKAFDFHGNAMRQFNADHVGHVIDLFDDITIKQEFNLEKLIKRDNFGRLVWNNEEMQKMIDSTWKHLRYAFDNRNFLYDNPNFGWWHDEKLNADGSVSRTPHFGLQSIRELMFSKKVRDMDMYERKDVSSWKPGSGDTKMGRNVFGYLIAAQLREHTRKAGGHYKFYSAEEVETITEAFLMYAARVMKGQDGEAIVLSGFFNPEEMMRILVAGHAILWWLYMKEYGFSMSGGLLFGFFDALLLIMKNAGAGIKL